MSDYFSPVKVLFKVKPTGEEDDGEPKEIVAGFKSKSSYDYFEENNDSLVCYLYRIYELKRKRLAFDEDTSDILDRFEWELIADPYDGPLDVDFYVADDYMGRHIDCYFLKRVKGKGKVLKRRDPGYIKRAIEKDNSNVNEKVESFRKVLESANQRFGK